MNPQLNECIIQVSHVMSNAIGEGGIRLTFTDPTSNTRFLQLHLTFEQFGEIVGSTSAVTVPVGHYLPDHVGKTREIENVFLPLGYDNWDSDYERLVSELEVDGWKINREARFNRHRLSDKGYAASRFRFV